MVGLVQRNVAINGLFGLSGRRSRLLWSSPAFGQSPTGRNRSCRVSHNAQQIDNRFTTAGASVGIMRSCVVAPVLGPGTTGTLYLPSDALWTDVWTAITRAGGSPVTVAAPLVRIPLPLRDDARPSIGACEQLDDVRNQHQQ